jgi:iron-sulfur cluster assembly protein CyaY
MDESQYLSLAERTFRSIEAALDAADAEDVDCERAGDVLTLTFKDNRRCVLNTQRPTRQLWLAANARAWHFNYDESVAKWLDDKGKNEELFATLTGIIKEHAGIDVDLTLSS